MRGSISSKPNINPVSNKLIDILDDEKKVAGLNEDYHYRQSVLPRLMKLKSNMDNLYYKSSPSDAAIIRDDRYSVLGTIDELKDNPQYRLTSNEMRKYNDLWKKYK